MRSKFLALIVAVIVTMSACFVVACDKDPEPTPQPPEPEYVSLSLDEFSQAIEGYMSIENLMEVMKYKLDYNLKTQIDLVTMETDVTAILDFSQLDDVSASVNITNVTVTPPAENSNTYVPEETEAELNFYLYSNMLYVDVTADGETLKDSMEVNNDITQLIAQLITAPSEAVGISDLPQIDEELSGDYLALMEYFEDYITVKYCSELGHYVIDLDYSQGGVYQGEHIDPFAFNADVYVKNGRITGVEFGYRSLEINLEGNLTEHVGSIAYPQNPSEYNSILFEMIEESLMGGALN